MRYLLTFLCLLLLTTAASAQSSLTIAGRYQKFIGGDSIFPYGEVGNFPGLAGLEARFTYGLSYRLAVGASVSYMRGISRGEFQYSQFITTVNQGGEFSANLRYYLIGAYNAPGGFYAIGGLSAGFYQIDWQLAEGGYRGGQYLFPEPEYFQDRQFWLLSGNAGLGGEVFLGSFYLFAEARGSYRFKDYVSNVTIYEPHLHHYWSANLGVRIPLGG